MSEGSRQPGDVARRQLIARRNRLRLLFSVALIGAYLAWAVGGLYRPDAYAATVAGTAVPWGMAVGLLIIVASIVGSIAYVALAARQDDAARRNGVRHR